MRKVFLLVLGVSLMVPLTASAGRIQIFGASISVGIRGNFSNTNHYGQQGYTTYRVTNGVRGSYMACTQVAPTRRVYLLAKAERKERKASTREYRGKHGEAKRLRLEAETLRRRAAPVVVQAGESCTALFVVNRYGVATVALDFYDEDGRWIDTTKVRRRVGRYDDDSDQIVIRRSDLEVGR